MPVYTYTILDDPSSVGFDTHASGINDAGQVVGAYNHHGFLYSPGASNPWINIDDPLATEYTVAKDITATGLIVGYYRTSTNHGFIYNPSTGVYSTFDPPGSAYTIAYDINNAGQIVGEYEDNVGSGLHGFLLNGSVYTILNDPLGSHGTAASGINSFGQIVGYYFDDAFKEHGFLYNPSNGSFTTLDNPLGTQTGLTGINDFGQIVGHYISADFHTHGFLYSGGTYTPLDLPNSSITLVSGINNAGVISGTYEDSSRGTHGFILTITPNPPPPAGTTADMILRASNSSQLAGQYEIYDIGNNAILSGNSLGQVGTDWQYAGLGGFFSSDTSDMLLRNSTTGGFQVYDISNNNITGSAFPRQRRLGLAGHGLRQFQ